MQEIGERLRRLGASVVLYQTPVPVEKGVELYGAKLRDMAEHNFATLERAFVSGFGETPVVRTGFTAPTEQFVDWRDGSEHLNDLARSTAANAVVDAALALRS